MAIKVLSKQVINQIAAGEVVEKPASVVKELVENSIDAKSTNITIEIKNGGIDYICIIDNGHGIKQDEVALAFTSHATSKLKEIDDLDTLNTMGFRGEALATISAVSNVCMITKTQDQETGICVKLDGGEQKEIYEVASVTGTKIEVKDLFFNTPARLKFLRKPKSEENDITNYVEKLILANINISFKYIVDGKVIYNTVAGDIKNTIYALYGNEISENLLKVNFMSGAYSVTGFISKPMLAKANRSYQSLFVNNRFCNNSMISSAVSQAYENFSMKGKFPVYILYLTMPKNELDVNVHPNKLEVKFENPRNIYSLFNNAIYKTLYDYNHIMVVEDDVDNEKQLNLNEKINVEQNIKENEGISQNTSNYNKLLNSYSSDIQENNHNTGSYNFNLTNNLLNQTKVDNRQTQSTIPEINLMTETRVKKDIEIKEILPQPSQIVQQDFKDVLNIEYTLVGKAFNTYLILEYEDKLYFIDQHAAHERQKYDEILKQISSSQLKVQDLLIPYNFKVNSQESNFFVENLDLLNEFGINICEFGYNSFKVSSVPLILSDINIKDFFDDILKNLISFAKSPKEVIKTRFMQMACKSAVKGGDDLSDIEIKSLLNTLKDATDVLLCPHGRPIVVELTQKTIEKWFKRIV